MVTKTETKTDIESQEQITNTENNTNCISLTEHMNFWDIYHNFINEVNYCFFSNRNQIDQLKNFKNNIYQEDNLIINTNLDYNNKKNIFIGNTKYDNNIIFKKYNLDPNNKYCLFLFPKIRLTFENKDILNIYSHLKKLGFKIIVKTRPKDYPIDDNLKGDFLVCSDTYPNESLINENIRISYYFKFICK